MSSGKGFCLADNVVSAGFGVLAFILLVADFACAYLMLFFLRGAVGSRSWGGLGIAAIWLAVGTVLAGALYAVVRRARTVKLDGSRWTDIVLLVLGFVLVLICGKFYRMFVAEAALSVWTNPGLP